MADKHPYVTTIGGLSKALNQLRNAFPPTVTANTLKKLGIAPNNESYVISALRFLGFIDENQAKTTAAGTVFSHHDTEAFAQAFEERVRDAYSGLFELHGDSSWDLQNDQLISFFRGADQTSAIVGKRQASTFRLLAQFAGHGDPPDPEATGRSAKTPVRKTPKRKESTRLPPKSDATKAEDDSRTKHLSRVGLTVRIEINLPAEGDQATYDRIFQSIRENLLDD